MVPLYPLLRGSLRKEGVTNGTDLLNREETCSSEKGVSRGRPRALLDFLSL